MREPKIFVVLVTYNRKACLNIVLDALRNQTKKISGILLVDNCSTDDTCDYLIKSRFTCETKVEVLYENESEDGVLQVYYRNSTNLGGSGGFAKALDLVQKYESDYIWIMDDDVCPESDCLEKLLSVVGGKYKACIPNRTDSNFQDHACLDIDLKSLKNFGITSRKTFATMPLSRETYIVKDMAFEGPLVATEIIRKIGLPEAGFFIEFDDTDYAMRIRKYSEIVFVTSACLHRQLARKESARTATRKYTWRNYYSIRNNILFNHMHCETWRARHMSTLFIWGKHVLKALYYGHPENIKIINKAVIDGICNKYGKTIEPGKW